MKVLWFLGLGFGVLCFAGCSAAGNPPMSAQEAASFDGASGAKARQQAIARGMQATPPGAANPAKGSK
jgi:hypothetical protein